MASRLCIYCTTHTVNFAPVSSREPTKEGSALQTQSLSGLQICRGEAPVNHEAHGCYRKQIRGGEGLVPISDRDKEKYCKTMYEWVLSPLKYAALPVCLCTLGGGNLPDFDVTMWKYNYTISRETLACHIIFTLGQSDCVLYLSIYPTSSLSGWGHFFLFFFLFRVLLLTPDVFKWLVYGSVPVFRHPKHFSASSGAPVGITWYH